MSVLPFVRPDLDIREPDTKNDSSSFFLTPFFWPFFYVEQAFEHGVRMERHALLDARNQIQLTVAKRMFPEKSDFQSLCLFSEVCRQRFDHLIKQSPWLIDWYRIGLQEFVIQTTLRHICHHRECHLCKNCDAA